jgi:hypothetical protein
MQLSKRAIASRANGALSRGPKTEGGKRRSSANSLRHGLLAKCVVLRNESQETFAQHLDQHLQKLNPADDVEQGVVEEMAAAAWRLRRLWSIETTLLDKCVEKRPESGDRARIAAAFAELSSSNELHLLDRYEARLHRMYQRSLHNLLVLREFDSPVETSGEITPLPNEPSSDQERLEQESFDQGPDQENLEQVAQAVSPAIVDSAPPPVSAGTSGEITPLPNEPRIERTTEPVALGDKLGVSSRKPSTPQPTAVTTFYPLRL